VRVLLSSKSDKNPKVDLLIAINFNAVVWIKLVHHALATFCSGAVLDVMIMTRRDSRAKVSSSPGDQSSSDSQPTTDFGKDKRSICPHRYCCQGKEAAAVRM